MPKPDRPERVKAPSAKRKLARANDDPRAGGAKKPPPPPPGDESSPANKDAKPAPRRRQKPRQPSEKRRTALSGPESYQKEKRGVVDFSKLDMEALSRYRRHFRIPAAAKQRKADLAQAVADHFATQIHVAEHDEREIVQCFWSLVGEARQKKRRRFVE